jgi:hypothetical protein
MPRHVRRLGVYQLQYEGSEYLAESLRGGAGVLVASNHCRSADPIVIGLQGARLHRYFYFLTSYHLFKQHRLTGWYINRIGGYSIHREGADREAIRASAGILADGARPLLLFPEGTWFRQNDRLGPLQEGMSLIARQALKQVEQQGSGRPVLIHPVAIKYWLLADPRPALAGRLARLERRIGWRPQEHLDLVERVEKLGGALLTVKEIEVLGGPGAGTLDERIARLTDALAGYYEKQQQVAGPPGPVLDRVRRLRQKLVRRMAGLGNDPVAAGATRLALDDLLLCENLSAHSQKYLRELPSLERLTESVERLEETVLDAPEDPVAPLGAVATFGPALDVRAFAESKAPRGTADPLQGAVAAAIQGLLDRLLAQGPPATWGCPVASRSR